MTNRPLKPLLTSVLRVSAPLILACQGVLAGRRILYPQDPFVQQNILESYTGYETPGGWRCLQWRDVYDEALSGSTNNQVFLGDAGVTIRFYRIDPGVPWAP